MGLCNNACMGGGCDEKTFATGLGLGLAFWKGAEGYKDVKYIATSLNNGLYTALNNEELKSCIGLYGSGTSCDTKLVKPISYCPTTNISSLVLFFDLSDLETNTKWSKGKIYSS